MYSSILLPLLLTIVCASPAVRQSSNCTAPGGKCAGAPNYPFVPYKPCCNSNLVCAERESPPEGTWGRFCISPADAARNTTSASGNETTTTTTPPVVQETTTPNTTSGAAEQTTAPNATATTAPNATETTAPNATETTLPNGTTVSVSPSPSGDNDSVCFPASGVVELVSGSRVTMDQLSVGDVVKVGPNEFSKVFMFTHKLQREAYDFVQITTATGAAITLTGGHYIPVGERLVSASCVGVGSEITLGNGALDRVVLVKNVRSLGLYNPQTLHGNIVVDGVVASTYTTAVEPRLAHAILAPFRSLSTMWGLSVSAFESRGGLLALVAPRGALVL